MVTGILPTPSASSNSSPRRPRREPHLALPCSRWVAEIRGGKEAKSATAPGVGAKVSAVIASALVGHEEPEILVPDERDASPLAPPPKSYAAYMDKRRNAHLGSLLFNVPLTDHGHRASMTNYSMRSSVQSSSVCSDADSCGLERGLPEVVAKVKELMEDFVEDDENSERFYREEKYAEALLSVPGIREVAEKHGLHEGDVLLEVTRLFAECDANLSGCIPQHEVTTIFRRMGHAVPSRNVFNLIEKVLQEKFGIIRQHIELDFSDVLEIVGAQVAHAENLLKGAYEKFRGLERPVKVTEVGKALETLNLHPRSEQLRRIAGELHILSKDQSSVEFTKADQLFKLTTQSRELEKQRALHRAGYSHEQVAFFMDAFEKVAGDIQGELDKVGLFEVLEMIRAMPDEPEEVRDLEELMKLADINDNGLWSFDECLHLVRRFHDKEEYNQTLLENAAAKEAELSREELGSLKALFLMLVDEVGVGEFTYYALTKALRLLVETSITVEQNASLQQVFREHAKPSKAYKDATADWAQKEKKRLESGEPRVIEALQLPMPGFILIIGRLWHDDLLGTERRGSDEFSSSHASSSSSKHRKRGQSIQRKSVFMRLQQIVPPHMRKHGHGHHHHHEQHHHHNQHGPPKED